MSYEQHRRVLSKSSSGSSSITEFSREYKEKKKKNVPPVLHSPSLCSTPVYSQDNKSLIDTT